MQKKLGKLLSISLIAMMIISFTISIQPALAETRLYMDPSSIVDPGIAPSQEFNITVWLESVVDLYTWQFTIDFDPTVLECISASLPTDHIFAGKVFFVAPPSIDNVAGTMLYGATLLGEPAGVDGTGKLARIFFRVKARGATAITFVKPYPATTDAETFLQDTPGAYIPFTSEGSYFDNREAVTEALVFVDPPRIVNLTLTPSHNFAININIEDANYLYSYQLNLTFDPTVLNAVEATAGDVFEGLPYNAPPATINNETGYVVVSASLTEPSQGVSGSGTLATITFHVEALGATDLILSQIILGDPQGEPLPFSKSDGYFNNVMLAKLAVEPSLISDPALVPPAKFKINITVAEVENLYAYEFNLSFSPSVLTVVSVTVNDVFGETNYDASVMYNSAQGFVWVSVAYYPPAVPITTLDPVALVTIELRVKALGITVLDLHDTSLTDDMGQPIAHEVFDGYFQTLRQDIAVLNVTTDVNAAYTSWIVYVNVTVKNEGDLEDTFELRAYADPNTMVSGDEILIGTQMVTLSNGDNTTVTLAWDTTAAASCRNYTVSANSIPLPFETDISDNTFVNGEVKIKLMGDINGDGTVDMRDAQIIAAAFGSYPGHPRWRPDANLKRDNVIDMRDLALLASNFGQNCP